MSPPFFIIARNESNRKAQETVQMYTLHREYLFLIFAGSSNEEALARRPCEFGRAERRCDKIYEATNRGSAKIERTVSETIKADVRKVITVRLMSYRIDHIETGLPSRGSRLQLSHIYLPK